MGTPADYLQATDQILGDNGKGKKQNSDGGFDMPQLTTVEKLNQAATAKLGEIVRKNTAGEPLWQGYDSGEIAAARKLLEQTASNVTR